MSGPSTDAVLDTVLIVVQTLSPTKAITHYCSAIVTSHQSLDPMAQASQTRKLVCSDILLEKSKASRMDAISFVLGIKSSHLRSAHLRDLVYRGRVLRISKINGDGSATTNGINGHTNGDAGSDDEDGINGTQERNDPKSAWVMAVYEDDAGDEQLWKRTITNQAPVNTELTIVW